MSKTYSAGIVTAYGAAKRAGYQGTYEDFCRQQAGYAGNAAAVEAAKTAAQTAANTATTKAGEATTAATAAQTAKTQTEAAASQALTDIGTARTSAISAVQTEGQTQTASARAQAQAAAQSANTASTKASEASASATSAGQSATNAAASATNAASSAGAAQGVLESIPSDYSDLSEDVDQLKADLKNTLTQLQSNIKVYDKDIVKWIDISSYTNEYIKADGTRVQSSHLRTSEYIPVKSGDTVTASGMNLNIGGETIFGIACYDKNKSFISGIGITGSSKGVSGSFVVNDTTEYIAISDVVDSTPTFGIKAYTYDIAEKTEKNTEQIEELNSKIYAPLSAKKIAMFGDSIFGLFRPPVDVSTFLAGMTGATCYNFGFGGCRMGWHSNRNYDAFSMYRLADCIATNDYTLQDTALEGNSLPDYYATNISLMKSTNWSEIDVLLIEFGTNDFADGLRASRPANDTHNQFCFVDASLQYIIETIQTAYPNIRIFVVSPHYRFWLNGTAFLDDSNTHVVTSWIGNVDGTLLDFVEAEKETAKNNQIPFIDDYYDLGINKFNRSEYFADTTHHNKEGRKLIAKHLAHELY